MSAADLAELDDIINLTGNAPPPSTAADDDCGAAPPPSTAADGDDDAAPPPPNQPEQEAKKEEKASEGPVSEEPVTGLELPSNTLYKVQLASGKTISYMRLGRSKHCQHC